MTRHEAEQFRSHINQLIESLDDETALSVMDLFLPWENDTYYYVDDVRRYIDGLYRCTQEHRSQADWTPDRTTPTLWVQITIEEWPEWVQPVSAQTAYMFGDKVSHNDKHWISDYDNNTWEPGVFGWHEAE